MTLQEFKERLATRMDYAYQQSQNTNQSRVKQSMGHEKLNVLKETFDDLTRYEESLNSK